MAATKLPVEKTPLVFRLERNVEYLRIRLYGEIEPTIVIRDRKQSPKYSDEAHRTVDRGPRPRRRAVLRASRAGIGLDRIQPVSRRPE